VQLDYLGNKTLSGYLKGAKAEKICDYLYKRQPDVADGQKATSPDSRPIALASILNPPESQERLYILFPH
jgi:hypothetical protein